MLTPFPPPGQPLSASVSSHSASRAWRLVCTEPGELCFGPPAEPVRRRVGILTDAHARCGPAGVDPEALDLVRRAIDRLVSSNVDSIINLGDLIEAPDAAAAEAGLGQLRELFDSTGLPTVHLPGNHCLDHLPEPRFAELMHTCATPAQPWSEATRGSPWLAVLGACRVADGTGYSTRGPGVPHDWTVAHLGSADVALLRDGLPCAVDGAVVAVHQRLDFSGRYEIANAPAARALLAAAPGPVLVLHGHSHRRMVTRCGGVVHLTVGALRDAPSGGELGAVVELAEGGSWQARFLRP